MEPKVSEFLVKKGLAAKYPGGRDFAICLTHDIDTVYPKRFYEMKKLARKMRFKESLKMALSRQNSAYNPLWNFSRMMDIEKKYGAKSSFYFLALEPGERDFNFRIEEVREVIKNIADAGWEVGLHGGHGVHDNLKKIKKEKARLEKTLGSEVVGYRGHFLRFSIPNTWEHLHDAGFKYDTTFGYADCVGFRNGMCHPFNPYNLNTRKFIDILEIPLNIMDCAFPVYMRFDYETSWEATKRMIDTVKKLHGVVTLVWHNTYMEGQDGELYEKILRYGRNEGAWLTSAKELCNWWNENDFYGDLK